MGRGINMEQSNESQVRHQDMEIENLRKGKKQVERSAAQTERGMKEGI